MSKPIPSAGAIVVMGVCGCDKSTMGHKIVAVLDSSFLEGDAFHPSANVEKDVARRAAGGRRPLAVAR